MSDRCFPHGARACRRCETPGELLDAGKLEQLRRAYDNENWRGWGVTRVVHDLIDALVAERAAHATTKAELERAEKDSIIYADKFESATARAASEFKRANDNAEKLRATRERAEAAEAKVARVEALVNRGGRTLGIREVRDWALAGDGDD